MRYSPCHAIALPHTSCGCWQSCSRLTGGCWHACSAINSAVVSARLVHWTGQQPSRIGWPLGLKVLEQHGDPMLIACIMLDSTLKWELVQLLILVSNIRSDLALETYLDSRRHFRVSSQELLM